MPAELKVDLIAKTDLVHPDVPGGAKIEDWMYQSYRVSGAESLAEFAGRACYLSFDKPNPATRDNVDYLENIIQLNHTSVLEHASFSFYVQGVSRALTHELVRHRVGHSYSQLSQRYVDQSVLDYVLHPTERGDEYLERAAEREWDDAIREYHIKVNYLVNKGIKGKKARQVARMGLPERTETRIVFTGNGASLRHFLQKRTHPSADEEIQEFALEVENILLKHAPNLFQQVD